MIGKDQNEACLRVGKAAQTNPAWRRYGEYCLCRERGLRKQAFAHLDAFLDETKSWEFDERKEFVQWLCDKMDAVANADYGPYPAPLEQHLFCPVFDEWIQKVPENAEVLALKAQYGGDFESYAKAVLVDPHNQRARAALASYCVSGIWHATHHLPEYFIGKEDEILLLAEEAREHIGYLREGIVKQHAVADLIEEEQLLKDWIEFRSEEANDFGQWCKDKGRQYKWVKHYYYEK